MNGQIVPKDLERIIRIIFDIGCIFDFSFFMIYSNLRKYFVDVKNHADFTYKSIPFFNQVIRDIKVELLKISTQQGEQISRDVSDAMRLIAITEREDLSGIQNYPREIPKYLARVKTAIISCLAFVNK